MNGLKEAELKHDALEPVERELPEWRGDSAVMDFIRDFAGCGADPAGWLAEMNVTDDLKDDVAEVLQRMAIVYSAGHHYADQGNVGSFWQLMKRFALDSFDYSIKQLKGEVN